jgi:hypothetical protein
MERRRHNHRRIFFELLDNGLYGDIDDMREASNFVVRRLNISNYSLPEKGQTYCDFHPHRKQYFQPRNNAESSPLQYYNLLHYRE